MPWYVIQTGHQLCSCFRTSPSPNWDRRSSGQGCKPTQTQHRFSLLTLPASQKHPSPVCTQAASTALSAVRTVLSSPARLEPVCRSLPVARRRSQRPVLQHAPGLPGAIPLHELTASPQSGQIALILPDISSGQRLPGCCGQRCFLALTWCLWLSVSILKAIGTAQAVRFVSSGSSGQAAQEGHAVTSLPLLKSPTSVQRPEESPRELSEREEADQHPIHPRSPGETDRVPTSQVETYAAASRAAKVPRLHQHKLANTRPHWEGTKGSRGTPPHPISHSARSGAQPCHLPQQTPSIPQQVPVLPPPSGPSSCGAGELGAQLTGWSWAGQHGKQQEIGTRIARAAAGLEGARQMAMQERGTETKTEAKGMAERRGAMGRPGHLMLQTRKPDLHQPCCSLPSLSP